MGHCNVLTASATVASLLCTVACAGEQPPADWQGTTRDSAGVTIVENPAEGVWTEASAWTIEELLRIGAVEGPPEYQFGSIVGMELTAAGHILVLDTQAETKIRVFGADGIFLGASGGTGAGPGELSSSAGPLLLGRGDTLYVPDARRQRVSLYGPDGTFLRSIPTEFGAAAALKWDMTAQGEVVFQLNRTPMPGDEGDPIPDVIAAWDEGDAGLDTLLHFPAGETFTFQGGRAELEFFAPEPWWTVAAGDGIWLAASDAFRISRYSSGRLERIVTREAPPPSVTPQDRENVLDGLVRLFSRIMPGSEGQIRDMTSFRQVLPYFQRLASTPDGSLWVQRIEPPRDWTEDQIATFDPDAGFGGRTWDVFDPSGHYLGPVEMPDRFNPLFFDDYRIGGVWRDELDVQHVMIIRVVQP